ncbi:uncharacterized protein KY384_002844 [Bacidia gigantensis]|uniref:uncharacterized protein n=1 Tax=Bacidia gigantensis TaxID=2732470 RepID=UPI001D057A4A|nr:uncharacterized protein KY384_002844 [Bacidia gigantensis]KAG8532359.1 hypothetical protein KY384_002844 [Bacidia gigantensis]
MTNKKARDVVDALGIRDTDRSITEIKESWARFNKMGKHLDALCKEMGTGALFWLHRELSANFVLNIMNNSGDTFNAAIQHLHDLGLKEKAESYGNLLGDNVRLYMARQFQIDAIRKKQ